MSGRRMSNFTVKLQMTSPEGNRYTVDTSVQARDPKSAKAIAAETMRLNNPNYSVLAKAAFFEGFVPEAARAEK